MINNVFAECEIKSIKSDVDVNGYSRIVKSGCRWSRES